MSIEYMRENSQECQLGGLKYAGNNGSYHDITCPSSRQNHFTHRLDELYVINVTVILATSLRSHFIHLFLT